VSGAGDDTRGPADFMAHGYNLIQEPLNLGDTGRRWWADICASDSPEPQQHGLVLGATPWLGALLSRTHACVTFIDGSDTMLANARAELGASVNARYVQSGWHTLPKGSAPVDTVCSDNGFSYLKFPAGWAQLCDELASGMRPGARLFARALSCPNGHRQETATEIVSRFAGLERINYTEVRAALLFSHWRDAVFSIDTQRALDTYDANAAAFATLLPKGHAGEPNDLQTMEKYRGAGAVYYAPPLDQWLAVVRRRFRVEAVHFGPYAMGEYFPLVSAVRR
jgi:hypothetical protein